MHGGSAEQANKAESEAGVHDEKNEMVSGMSDD
jgi:hypothetical protein